MQPMDDILDVSCDEAGHTGPGLLDRDQRYFGFASVALTDEAAVAATPLVLSCNQRSPNV
jgi:hypothetical protein